MENEIPLIVIVISGRKGAGKDWLANIIANKINSLPSYFARVGVNQFAYAKALKDIGKTFGFSDNELNEPDFKNNESLRAKQLGFITPRDWMIHFGNWARETYHPNIWVDLVKHSILDWHRGSEFRVKRLSNDVNVAIISDCRYENEFKEMQEFADKLIHIHVVDMTKPTVMTMRSRMKIEREEQLANDDAIFNEPTGLSEDYMPRNADFYWRNYKQDTVGFPETGGMGDDLWNLIKSNIESLIKHDE